MFYLSGLNYIEKFERVVKEYMKNKEEILQKLESMTDRDAMEYAYVDLNLSRIEMCEIFDMTIHTMKRKLKKLQIRKPDFLYHPLIQDKEWLSEQFVNLERTITEIAKETGHTKDVIVSKIKEFGLDSHVRSTPQYRDLEFLKTRLQTDKIPPKELADQMGISITTLRRHIQKNNLTRKDIYDSGPYKKLFDVDWISQQRKIKTQKEIAFDLGISASAVSKACAVLNITEKPDNFASDPENKICEYLKSHEIDHVVRNRSILNGKELDIYIPSKSLAIEFNGNFWHSSTNISDKLYHQNKSVKCRELGIRLFHIWEHQWEDVGKKKIILDKINSFCDIDQQKIRASSCVVSQISHSEYTYFMDVNHLQGGSVSCSIRYALRCLKSNQLMAVMSFSKPRYRKDFDLELIRFCTKNGYRVHGGASKIWKKFKTDHPDARVISYCDLDYGNGKLYENLGMREEKITPPGYFYYKQNGLNFKIVTRYQAQKHRLENLLGSENYDPKLTEKQNMELNKFRIVYNSGNLVYISS